MKRVSLFLASMFGAVVSAASSAHAQDSAETPQLHPASGVRVELAYDENGSELLTIQARDASTRALLSLVARKLRLELAGLDEIDRDPKITAVLVERPYRDAIRWALGSVGLRARIEGKRLEVTEDVAPYPTSGQLFEEASRRYFTALKDHADWPLADRAQMALAEIEERLGPARWNSAVLWYDALVRDYPDSELVPEALLRCARVLGRTGDWSQAVLRYQDLAELPTPHPYHVTARRELATMLCRLGEAIEDPDAAAELGERALHFLDALESNYMTRDPAERRERFLVRSRALSLTGDSLEALRALDAAERHAQDGAADPEVAELRARAFARAGDHGSASTAWLVHADQSFGAERERGIVEAARAALEGGHEIAVLAIERMARNEGFADRLAVEATEARLRLGLPTKDVSGFGARANWLRGRALVEQGSWSAAADALALAWSARNELDREEARAATLAYADALGKSARLGRAIEVLREAVSAEPSTRLREPYYRLASELYEEHEMLDQAIEALKGRL